MFVSRGLPTCQVVIRKSVHSFNAKNRKHLQCLHHSTNSCEVSDQVLLQHLETLDETIVCKQRSIYRGGSRICGKGGCSGYRERRRREGFWRVPFEDPLWNFKRGGRAPPAPPPPLNPLVIYVKDYTTTISCKQTSH